MYSEIESIIEYQYSGDVYNLHVEDNHNYYANGILVSNCHEAKAASITGIIHKMPHVKFRYGFTGTLQDTKTHEMQLKGLFGNVHKTITTKELMDNGTITELKIEAVSLKYTDEEKKYFYKNCKDYDSEIKYIVTNEKRNDYIIKTAMELENNCMIIFNYVDIQGNVLYNLALQKSIEYNKQVFYIHGEVSTDERERIRNLVSEHSNIIIIASSGCFRQGINMPGLHHAIFAHPYQAKIRTLQTIGRVLRKNAGKEYASIIDISDDLCYNKKVNITYKHYIARLKIYENERFQYKIINKELV
ncbi:MAG: helicase-related protein [Flavobacterium sp.]|uniref:helicase-related protein n=1 Tax=Flavobacterium sp. TaxID=239 RepID=UPI0026117E49|nr:helicase-related protein [Flavobacterium sp.]MDD5151791.1 helicase-related protein [Flavobacterium sp.]